MFQNLTTNHHYLIKNSLVNKQAKMKARATLSKRYRQPLSFHPLKQVEEFSYSRQQEDMPQSGSLACTGLDIVLK